MKDAFTTVEGACRVNIKVLTEDGVELSATCHTPEYLVERELRGVAIIAAGVGLRQDQYNAYAAYLVSKGWVVMTFDYRGIGNSVLERNLESLSCLRDWGRYDLSACIEWASTRYAGSRIVVVAHSVGGQIFAFAPNHDKVEAVIAVCSQKGYWKFWDGARRFQLMFLWYVLPVLVSVFGYLPLQLMGKGADIPAGIAREWGRWGRVHDFVDKQGRSLNFTFAKVTTRFLSISFTDDTFYAPRRSVEALNELYINTRQSHWHLSPEVLDCDAVGHTGFFRNPERLQLLWDRVDSWLEQKPDAITALSVEEYSRDLTCSHDHAPV